MSFPKLLALAVLLGGSLSRQSFCSPTADEIIASVKAHSVEAISAKNRFAYQRVSRVDYLDEKGEVKKNSVRVYEVAPLNGQPCSKLVQVNGRPATPEQEARRSAARETGDKSRNLAFGEDLLVHYDYKLLAEDVIAGRKTWVLEFSPKRGAPEDSFLDKLLNAMQGKMWVDQEDYELARIDGHLGKKVSFFGGLAGAIEKLDLQLVQKRVGTAAWLTEALSLDFSGRKLLSPIHLRCLENCSEFRKISPLADK